MNADLHNGPPPGGILALGAFALALLSLAFGVAASQDGAVVHAWQDWPGAAALLLILGSALRALKASGRGATLALTVASLAGAMLWLQQPPARGDAPGMAGFWLVVLALALLASATLARCAALQGGRLDAALTASVFGAWMLLFWQLLVIALEVPRVLLPAPEFIAKALFEHAATLRADFVQTVLKAVLAGWLLGSALGFVVAIAIDRVPFLQRGLLPLASLTSAVPLVGVAPIMVMWFGFEWQSKAAVVVLMTFFPMLVSTLAGLGSAGRIERELMHSYAAGYGRTLVSLRLPAALPFIAGALKVNATLALIGAIVAEFFGSPTVGLGFRISTEAVRMNMPLVWAAIAVASLTGCVSYALLVRLEQRVAFWHPSVRSA